MEIVAAQHAGSGRGKLISLAAQARVACTLLPRQTWYRAALCFAALHGALSHLRGKNGAFTRAVMLDHWLRELSFRGAFPIPYRVRGAEVFQAPGPKMFTWTHLPLAEMPLRAFLEMGAGAPAVVSDPGKVVGQNEFLVFGCAERLPALRTNDHLLARVKSTLQAGRSVCFLADPYLGGPLSEVPLRMAARLRVPLIVQWAELGKNGTIEITVQPAPFPLSRTEEELAANLAFLREAKQRALARLGLPPLQSPV